MVNDILDAISIQLHATFGSDYRYYVENAEQNITKPCFTIDTIVPLQRSKSPVLYTRTMPIVVHYFTDDKKDTKINSYAMAEQVVECLEYLPFKNTILRGENISWQMVDDVLQIFITYRFTTVKTTPAEDDMEFIETPNIFHT